MFKIDRKTFWWDQGLTILRYVLARSVKFTTSLTDGRPAFVNEVWLHCSFYSLDFLAMRSSFHFFTIQYKRRRVCFVQKGCWPTSGWSHCSRLPHPGKPQSWVVIILKSISYWYDTPAKMFWWSHFLKVDLAGPPLPPSSLSTRARTSKPTGGNSSVLLLFFCGVRCEKRYLFLCCLEFAATNILTNKKHELGFGNYP